MIYEVRTYDIKPGTLAAVENAFEVALPARQKYSPLAAFWHTEIGPLNQIIHVWGYDSLEERERIRAEAVKDPDWPPKLEGNVINMNSEIWNPAPFMRPMGGDQALGNIYEMRTYTYEPGSIPELIRRWTDSLPYREEFSPPGCRHVHRVRRSEPVDARLAVQRPGGAQPDPGGSQQNSPVAVGGSGPHPARKTRW